MTPARRGQDHDARLAAEKERAMSVESSLATVEAEDPVGRVLKWVLLIVAAACFAALAWTTVLTYSAAPPLPRQITDARGTAIMTEADVVAGKAGFQKADLMDYGSLYGMGSYFGEDYTADNLVKIATLTEANIAMARFNRPLAALSADDAASVRSDMQRMLQGVDLTAPVVALPDPLARAMALDGCRSSANCRPMILARVGPAPTVWTRRPPRRPPTSYSTHR
jgi:nitric oxide reductase subunit B